MSNRQIRIIPSFTGYKEGVICFETQCSPSEVRDLGLYAFEHHGDAYSPFDPGALRLFHERILLGQDMPSTMVLTQWQKYDQLLAAAIFIQPSIVLEPACTSLVNSFDLIDRLGPPAYGHIPHDHKELAYMISNIADTYQDSQASSEKILEILRQCALVLINYVVEGTLPPVELPAPEYEIIAEDGAFVAFRAEDYVWDALWCQGYLWGIWFNGSTCRISRKSALVPVWEEGALLEKLQKEDPEGNWVLTNGVLVSENTREAEILSIFSA